MALSDFLLKTRVNMALIRDPRVGSLDIGVAVHDAVVTLTGDVDEQGECTAAEEVARSVDGVAGVRNEITCGIGKRSDAAEHVSQRFLDKLGETWDALPDQNALTHADYLRWALWMIYKFRLPEEVAGSERAKLEDETTEQAIAAVASRVGAPKAIVALELLRQAEFVSESSRMEAPAIQNAPLVATPVVEGAEDRAAG